MASEVVFLHDQDMQEHYTEADLTALFQKLGIGRAGERRVSDPTKLVTPMEVIILRRGSVTKPMMNETDEEVLLTVLHERSVPLSPVEFANVIGGWAHCYGWNQVKGE